MLRLRGIIYLAISSFFIWHEFGDKTGNEWMPQVERWASTNPTLEIIMSVVLFAFWGIVILYWFKGINFTFISGGLTMDEYKETPFGRITWSRCDMGEYLQEKSQSGNLNNIDRIKKYRETKMSTMTNEQKADEYKSTAWIDSLDSNSSRNTNITKDYINSKLSTMDNETAYKWLKNQK